MKDVYCTFDNLFHTWNVVEVTDDKSIKVLFYGDIDEMEKWLENRKDEYTVVHA